MSNDLIYFDLKYAPKVDINISAEENNRIREEYINDTRKLFDQIEQLDQLKQDVAAFVKFGEKEHALEDDDSWNEDIDVGFNQGIETITESNEFQALKKYGENK